MKDQGKFGEKHLFTHEYRRVFLGVVDKDDRQVGWITATSVTDDGGKTVKKLSVYGMSMG